MLAAVPALEDVSLTYDVAKVPGTVTSHVRHFLLDHGIAVTPSGLFPSIRQRPKGSFFAGILSLWIALKIASFKRSCLTILPELLLQEKECRPFAFTNLAQVQTFGSRRFEPRRRPIDILIASSESRKPMAVIGAAFSQAPDCGSLTAKSLVLSSGKVALSS